MTLRFERDRVRAALALIGCALVALGLAACGGDSESSSPTGSGGSTDSDAGGANSALVEEAEQRIAEARQPLTEFPGPTEPAGKPPAGKNIAIVKVVASPYPDHQAEGAEAAAEANGWSFREFTADGTPTGIESTFRSAMATKPDAVVLCAMPVAFMQKQLADAKKQGIPVVAMTPGLPLGKTPEQWNLLNEVVEPSKSAGETLAYWVIQESPEGAKAIRLESPEFEDLNRVSKAFAKTLEKGAPEFSVVASVVSPVTDAGGGQTGVNRLATPLRKYTDADFMFINSENWAPTFLQAEVAANRAGEVTALGTNGDTSIPLIQEGKPIVVIAAPARGLGWFAVDALIRNWNDKPQVEYETEQTLVDGENADEYDTEYVEAKYDAEAEWMKVWK